MAVETILVCADEYAGSRLCGWVDITPVRERDGGERVSGGRDKKSV